MADVNAPELLHTASQTAEVTALGLDVVSLGVATIIGYIGVCIMGYGGMKNGYDFLICTIKKTNHLPYLRINLGKHLALGLEFLVGKDIIESIVRPTWEDLGKLAAIIAIRSVVSFMLSMELKELKEEIRQLDLKKVPSRNERSRSTAHK